MQSLVCLNGEVMPADEARVSVWDRGFLFGDAVYEVIRVYGGRCWLESAHLARLERSLHALDFPQIDRDGFAQRLQRTLSGSQVREGTVYIQITRGVAPRHHPFPDPPVPLTEMIAVRPYDDTLAAQQRATGVTVISHPDLRWKRCDIKSTNLLANVLACQTARRAGNYEAVLHDNDQWLTEATHTSVLWVRQGRLEGTPEGPAILPGTTRGFILDLARKEGFRFVAGSILVSGLAQCDEVFLVGTTSEIMPVVQVDGATVADGRPGPLTRQLQAAFTRQVDQFRDGGPSGAS